MLHMDTNRHIGVLFCLGGMTLGHLGLVRRCLMVP